MLHRNSGSLAAIGFEQWKPNGMALVVIAARGSFEITHGGILYAGAQKLVLANWSLMLRISRSDGLQLISSRTGRQSGS